MPAPSNAEVRQHIETDLTDPALNRLIAAAWSEVEQADGEASIEDIFIDEREPVLFTSEPISAITSIVKRDDAAGADETVDAADYRVRGRREILRTDGALWTGEVRVTFAPVIDESLRMSVLVELVRMMVEHRAPVSETSGGTYQADYSGMEERRTKALNRLRRDRLLIA